MQKKIEDEIKRDHEKFLYNHASLKAILMFGENRRYLSLNKRIKVQEQNDFILEISKKIFD